MTTASKQALDSDGARVAALEKYAILDSEPEQAFDDLTQLASYVCNTPIALISLVDEDRQWFKSKIGHSGLRNSSPGGVLLRGHSTA